MRWRREGAHTLPPTVQRPWRPGRGGSAGRWQRTRTRAGRSVRVVRPPTNKGCLRRAPAVDRGGAVGYVKRFPWRA